MAFGIAGVSAGSLDWERVRETVRPEINKGRIQFFPIPRRDDSEPDALGLSLNLKKDREESLVQWSVLLPLIERLEVEHGLCFVDLYSGELVTSANPEALRESFLDG